MDLDNSAVERTDREEFLQSLFQAQEWKVYWEPQSHRNLLTEIQDLFLYELISMSGVAQCVCLSF